MILDRILIAIIIGGLARIGYLLFLLAPIAAILNGLFGKHPRDQNGSKLGVCEGALSLRLQREFGLAEKAG
jgi:hypothetical protein